MPTQLRSTHRHGRRRYNLSTTRVTTRSVPLHRVSDVADVERRAGRLIQNSQTYVRGAYLETRFISANYYKNAYVLWFEPGTPQSVSSTSARNPSSERRAPRNSKNQLLAALRSHVGSWVAVREGRVIASKGSPLEIVEYLRKNNLRADSVFRVPRDSGEDVLGEL